MHHLSSSKQNPKHTSKQTLRPWAYLVLPLLGLGLFFYWPLLHTVVLSFQDFSYNLYEPTFVGLGNYQTLLGQGVFWNSLWQTLQLLALILPAIVALPIGLAVLVMPSLPGLSLFRTVFYLPVLVSMVIAGLTWKWLLASDGLLNGWLQQWGWPAVPWLTASGWALFSIALVTVWKALGYYMMLYLAQLQSRNTELYEAASLDGASPWQQHWHLTLPHLRPTILLVSLIGAIACLKLFTEVYVLTGGGPLQSTQTLVYYVYQQAFEKLNLGVACAAGLVVAALLFSLSWLQLKVFDSPTEASKGVTV